MPAAHKILITAFHMLQRDAVFADLGGDYPDRANQQRSAKHLVHRLGAHGYDVMPRAKAMA